MGRLELEGNPPIEVVLKRSARARRLSLRISRIDGRVTLTMPSGVPASEGQAFVRSREAWLRGHLGQVAQSERVGAGTVLPLEGRLVRVQSGSAKRIGLHGDMLMVPEGAAKVGPRVLAYLRTRARDRLAEASDRYSAALGRPFGKLTLRDTRSRWGSCTSAGDLMYSWRLIMAPPEVLDYVAAHEVAHLAEMNHSDAFWAVVQRLYPEHRHCRRWLKTEGDKLHRFTFSD